MNEAGQLVVIGSGPAGATAARVLADAGAQILLLEAGPREASLGLTARAHGVTFAKRGAELQRREGVTFTGEPEVHLFEALVPGGLSNHWSCAVPRFSREDFADAARAGEEFTWPLGYDDLVPWYERVEPLLHISGGTADVPQLPAGKVSHVRQLPAAWSAVADAARHSGRGIAPMPYAYGSDTTFTAAATAFNAFVRLVRPQERSGAIRVRYGARALRLEWSPSARRVVAVTVRDARTGSVEQVPCRGVILAAGAINTAQILLESAHADFPQGLGNEHGVLGRYFHDHPLGKLIIDLPKPAPIYPPVYITRLGLERSLPLYAAACMQWCGTPALARSVLRGRPGKLTQIGFSVFGTMAPSRDTELALDRTRPAQQGAAALTFNVRHPPESRQVLDETRDQVLALLTEMGWQPRLNSWRVEAVCNSVHYAGTCRMHASPRFGVVNAFSRLHAVPNVAVADSSVFTTGPEKNPVLTSMALAARASERLFQDVKSGDL